MRLWFVTPAYQRYELSAVCFEQRRRVIRDLAAHGIEAQCVVVADDDNLDLARGVGFATVEQNNDWLGRKFNDGIEYACKAGAEWVAPIGSDSWIDPAYFYDIPDGEVTLTSAMYAVVTAERMAALRVGAHGAGPYAFRNSLLAWANFRPAEDRIQRYVDGSTIRGIGRPIRWHQRDLHPFQYIGFRGHPHLTSYDRLMKRWGTAEHLNPWPILAEHYDPDLVAEVRRVLAKVPA